MGYDPENDDNEPFEEDMPWNPGRKKKHHNDWDDDDEDEWGDDWND